MLFIGQTGLSQEDSLRSMELDEIKISFSKEIAYGDTRYFITDFHVGERGNYLLMKRFSKYIIYHLDGNMIPTSELTLHFRPTKLVRDCLGYLHVMARDSIHQLEIIDNKVVIWDSNPISFYKNHLKTCVGVNETGMIHGNYVNFNQTLVYYQQIKEKRSQKRIYNVEDSTHIRSTREDAMVMARDSYMQSLKSGEIDSAKLKAANKSFDQSIFFVRHAMRPIYNPLFVKNDTSYIFDHLNGKVALICDTGQYIRSIPIDYHKERLWGRNVLFDRMHQRFYTLEKKGGVHTYCMLSSGTFNVIRRVKINEHAYPEKVIIYGGYIYYLYKTDLEDNLNKLFRQRLI